MVKVDQLNPLPFNASSAIPAENLRGMTQHCTKRSGSPCRLCSLWRMPRPAVMNLMAPVERWWFSG